MPNHRSRIHAFYQNSPDVRELLLEKTAAAAAQYEFRGPQVALSVVVRSDLNGYSSWAGDKSISERVGLLDQFFSSVVPKLTQFGGIFFRDEGDCIVSLFSDYFHLNSDFPKIRAFCKAVVGTAYGKDQLTAKSVVSCGNIAYFQKAHERNTGDWSAEGHPFVAAARLEQAVASQQHVVFFEDDYDRYFDKTATPAKAGGRVQWTIHRDCEQVAGLGFEGGWANLVRLEYVPKGRG